MKVETEVSPLPAKDIKVAPSVFDAFDLLKSPNEDGRINGAAKIVSFLQDNKSEKETQYTLKRLVRSLGANVPELRMGYFATLTELLRKNDEINLSHVLKLVKEELHASGSSSKSEVGDVALGQILMCGAVFRSGLMLKSTNDLQIQIIQLLLTASTKKSYLSVLAYQILLDFVNTLSEDQFSSIIWVNIKNNFKKELKEHTLDSLYFLMVVHKKFPVTVKFKKLLGIKNLICEDTIPTICEKIMTGIDFNSVNHPIYNEIAVSITNSPHLQLFWTGIDSQLIKHNRNRELVTLNILKIILDTINENFEMIPELFSKNFFKLFMDWFKGLQTASKIRNKRDDEEDHKIMIKKEREVLNSLAKALKSEKVGGPVKVETLKKLLFNPGDMNFSEVSGTSVTKSIIADLDLDGVKKMAKLFKGVLLNTTKKIIKEGVERNWYNNDRLKAAEGISYLVSHETVKDNTEFKLSYMTILMCFGFFKIGGNETTSINSDLSGTIKSCFYRCFSSRFSNVDSLVEVLSSLCSFINKKLQNDEVKEKMEKQFPKENMECWDMLSDICQTIEKNHNKSKVDKVFLILLYQLGLFLFSEPKHVEVAKSSIRELKSCYEHYKMENKKKQKKRKEELVDSEPEWIEVLVEVLLSILSIESSVLRSVVQCVFRLLYEYLTPSSIGQIVSVLDPDNESNPLTEGSDDSDNESEESEENDEEKEESEDDKASEASDNSDESDSEMEDDENVEMKTPDQLRMAIHKALGSAAPDTDTESVDADMIGEEEGKNLDAALAEAFKQFHGGKSKQNKKERKDKKSLSDFRIKVLDLIDIYLEKDPSMDVTLSMITPLIRCLEFCIQDSQYIELEKRLRKTIKLLTKIRKFSSTDDVDVNILSDYLKSIIEKGSRSHFMFQALGDVITHCATFIIHCSQKVNQNGKKLKKLTDIFKESFQSYFQNRNCLLPIIFFHNILQTDWEGVYELIPIAIENAFNKSVRQFRRNESLELLVGFYKALKRIKPTSKEILNRLMKIESDFESTVTKTIGVDKEFVVNKNFFVSLKKLINTMKLYHDSCHIETKIDFASLLELISSNKSVNLNAKVNEKVNGKTNEVEHNGNNHLGKGKKKKNKKRKAVNSHIEPVGNKKKKKLSES